MCSETSEAVGTCTIGVSEIFENKNPPTDTSDDTFCEDAIERQDCWVKSWLMQLRCGGCQPKLWVTANCTSQLQIKADDYWNIHHHFTEQKNKSNYLTWERKWVKDQVYKYNTAGEADMVSEYAKNLCNSWSKSIILFYRNEAKKAGHLDHPLQSYGQNGEYTTWS